MVNLLIFIYYLNAICKSFASFAKKCVIIFNYIIVISENILNYITYLAINLKSTIDIN